MKLFNLTDKVALITGGNGGIGFAMAKAIGEAGFDSVSSRCTKEVLAEILISHGVKPYEELMMLDGIASNPKVILLDK